jgi:REP-associated tyrosine transposase
MEQVMKDVCADFEVDLVEFDGEPDHVHLLVHFPPTVALAKLVNSLKGVSSRRLRQEFPALVEHCQRARKLWPASYSAGPVGGAAVDVAKQYIGMRNRPPRKPKEAIHLHPEGWNTLALLGSSGR